MDDSNSSKLEKNFWFMENLLARIIQSWRLLNLPNIYLFFDDLIKLKKLLQSPFSTVFIVPILKTSLQ